MPLLRPRVLRPDGRADGLAAGRRAIGVKQDDSLLAAIVKWIPVEVVTVYKAAMGIIPEEWPGLRLGTTGVSVAVTALWIAFATTPTPARLAWRQVIIAPLAFVCWAVATQADVMRRLLAEWEPWMALLVLCAGTVLLPIVDGVLRALGVPQN